MARQSLADDEEEWTTNDHHFISAKIMRWMKLQIIKSEKNDLIDNKRPDQFLKIKKNFIPYYE